MNARNSRNTSADRIIEICKDELRFARVGICKAQPTRHTGAFGAWLSAGKHGSMEWITNHLEKRLDPTRLLPGARSIILVADIYAPRGDDDADRPDMPERAGRIARYARGKDYHGVIKRRLHTLADKLQSRHPREQFKTFVDTAPILEREHAASAGLGWIGKHTLLIHPEMGSYFLLGGILTTLPIDPPKNQRPVEDHCGTCTKCIDACPTNAITPYSVDASRCISELTIENRGKIPAEFHEPIGDWLFGCDICQEVCPHNSVRPEPVRPEEVKRPGILAAYKPRRRAFDVLEVLGWTEEDRREAFTTSSMKRAKLDMMQRNALIVAKNLLREKDDPQLQAAVENYIEQQPL